VPGTYVVAFPSDRKWTPKLLGKVTIPPTANGEALPIAPLP
jgi:hypothetical protein